MPAVPPQVLQTVQDGFAALESELAASRARQTLSAITRAATGSGDIDEVFQLDCRFRLVFVRCHFTGTAMAELLRLALDSTAGEAYDAHLYTITRAGVGRDVNFRVSAEESAEPSPWTFQQGDALRITWTNPDSGNITWGLEVGLAVAS